MPDGTTTPPANSDTPLSTREDLTRDRVEQHESRSDVLEQRNVTDDARQDASDARQDRAEVRSHAQDVTLHDVLYILEGRMGHIELSMKDLATASNHRMEAFEGLIVKMDEKWTKALDKKADKDALLTSWGERLLRVPLARWMLGAAGLALITTAASQHWFIQVADWFEGFFH